MASKQRPLCEGLRLKLTSFFRCPNDNSPKWTVNTWMAWVSHHTFSRKVGGSAQMANGLIIWILFGLVSTSFCLDLSNKVYQWTKNVEDYQTKGKWLTNNWFFMSWTKMPSQCAYRCLKSPTCKSFNYDGNDGRCELNRKTHVDQPADLVDDVAEREYHIRDAYSIHPVS